MKIFVFALVAVTFSNTLVASFKAAKTLDAKVADLTCQVTERC